MTPVLALSQALGSGGPVDVTIGGDVSLAVDRWVAGG